MAPTICDDIMEPFGNQNRILRHRSVINYVGRQTSRAVVLRNEMDSSEKTCSLQRNHGFVRYTSEHRTIPKRYRQEDPESTSESDDSSDGIPNPMSFHNYAKRRRFSSSEDDTDKYVSTSSESNEPTENSVTSTLSFNEDRENENASCRLRIYKHACNPLSPASPVSSTTGSMAFYHRFPRVPLRSVNPFYQKDLIEIAMKTIILLQKNRSLHARLHQLKLETREFVDSVMSNPENAKLRQKLSPSSDKSMAKIST